MSNVRERLLQVKLNMRERATLEALSKHEGLSFSDLVRYLVRREVDRLGLEVIIKKEGGA